MYLTLILNEEVFLLAGRSSFWCDPVVDGEVHANGVTLGQVQLSLAAPLPAEGHFNRPIPVLHDNPLCRAPRQSSAGPRHRRRPLLEVVVQLEADQGQVDPLTRVHLDEPGTGRRAHVPTAGRGGGGPRVRGSWWGKRLDVAGVGLQWLTTEEAARVRVPRFNCNIRAL